MQRTASSAASRPACKLHRRGSAPVRCPTICADFEQGPDGGGASVANRPVQRCRPVLIDGVRVSPELDQAPHGFLLCHRIPSRRTWHAIDRVVERLRAATITGRHERANRDEVPPEAGLVRCRRNVQRGVPGIDLMAYLLQEMLLASAAGRFPRDARQRKPRCAVTSRLDTFALS